MEKSSYFIPTNSTILPVYFGSGIIMPSGHYKGFSDSFQNISNGAIVISEDRWLPGSNCSLEVILTSQEIQKLIPAKECNGLYILAAALPISRIKHIFFSENEQMDNTIWNIDSGTAFIPRNIVSSEKSREITLHNKVIKIDNNEEFLGDDLLKKARQFDILLGGFAFMKVSADQDVNYPHNYFSTLSFFNTLIKDQIKYAEETKKLEFDYSYAGLFTENSEWKFWKPYIFREIYDKDLEDIAKIQGVKLEKKLGQIKLDSVNTDSILFDLILLNTYGENKKKGLDDLFSFFEKANLSNRKQEEISLLFGVHIGYSKLRNSYNVNGRPIATKFKLESQLDYITIESLFQYVFNNNGDKSLVIKDLNYLTPVLPKPLTETDNPNLTTYRILDTTVITKEKEVRSNEALNSFTEFFTVLATDICSWGNANPIFKADLKVTEKYLIGKFRPLLDDVFHHRIHFEKIASNQKNLQVSYNDKLTIEPKSIVERTVSISIDDEFEQLNFSELKERARKKKLKVPSKLHGSTNDMEELKRLLRNTLSIL
ncbi:hypothetical protein [Mucilaginibacter terrae]|uniref:2-Component system ADP-ribosyltransferase domain-containing protein n=1 Tax=Mucilaginibacter terrae TaxID=1955052 RepID=A0ABU3GWZ4_9SPHI|nr:hypothetical protein [Mucilaginibacter terrae]MDT3404288.1 hypothetical protein [Mucilaginibacter terrae]